MRRVTIISGEISLWLNELLQFVSSTIGAVKGSINPWKFNWGYNITEIQNSEALTYAAEWLLKHDNIDKGFKPTLVIK